MDIDPEDHIDVQRYGLGLPFGFLIFGLLLMAWVFPGITSFDNLSEYGQVTVIASVLAFFVSLYAAIVTYRAVDTTWYKMTKEEDGPEQLGDES